MTKDIHLCAQVLPRPRTKATPTRPRFALPFAITLAMGVCLFAPAVEAQEDVTPAPVDTESPARARRTPAATNVFVCVSPRRSPVVHQPSEETPCASGETSISSNPLLLEPGGEDQFVVIRFVSSVGASVPVQQAEVDQVQLLVGESVLASLSSTDLYGRPDAVVLPISSVDAYPNTTRVTVQVRFDDQRTATRYFRAWNGGSFYGFGGTNAGFWFPIGLFATSFRSGPDGLQFSAFPVGLAWGGKVYLPRSDFYIGASAMVNWSILSGTPQSNPAATVMDTGVTLGSFSIGAVLDVGNYFYIGGAATFDFRSERELVSPMLVVGIAPGLLQILQAPR